MGSQFAENNASRTDSKLVDPDQGKRIRIQITDDGVTFPTVSSTRPNIYTPPFLDRCRDHHSLLIPTVSTSHVFTVG